MRSKVYNQYGYVYLIDGKKIAGYLGWISYETFIQKFIEKDTVNRFRYDDNIVDDKIMDIEESKDFQKKLKGDLTEISYEIDSFSKKNTFTEKYNWEERIRKYL